MQQIVDWLGNLIALDVVAIGPSSIAITATKILRTSNIILIFVYVK